MLVCLNLLLVEDSEELDETSEYQQTKDTIYVTALTIGFDMNHLLVLKSYLINNLEVVEFEEKKEDMDVEINFELL